MKKVMVALMLLLIESLLFYLYTIPTEAWAYSSVGLQQRVYHFDFWRLDRYR